jgi:hypothetical protein
MDVQGFELELLKGAINSLQQIKLIRFEASFISLYKDAPKFSEICLFLEESGFRFHSILGQIRSKESDTPVQGDFLFIRHKI